MDSLISTVVTVFVDNWIAAVAVATAYLVYSNRELIFGGRRKRIVVEVPKEITEEWNQTKIVGEFTLKNSNPNLMNCYDPTSGKLLGNGTAKAMGADDVKAAVQAARRAQEKWAQTSFDERREFLKLLMDFVVDNQENICKVAARDTGKTMVDGSFGEVLTTCEKLRWTIAKGEAALQPEYRDVGMMMIHKQARVEYVPMGVLGAIIPWNYPFHNMYGQIISALFAGNAIVIKVSEYSSWSAEYYGNIVKEALKRVGHSPDLVQLVTGVGNAGAALINSGVDKVTFIGSPAVGKLVMRAAADTLTPVVLELGGKDAAIVCDDCDFNQVVNLSLRGTFQNCGQNCIGLERVIVHEAVYDKFVEVMEKKVNSLKQGPTLEGEDVDCGAMTMGAGQLAGIQKLVDDAVAKGAKLLAGGCKNPDLPNGNFYKPTLLVDVTRDMEIARNEVFGPVMTVLKAKDDDDAVAISNSCEYGLGSSVFSLNHTRADAIAKRLRTGMCNINDFGVNYLCQSLPFGGVNISGFDRFAGVEGLRGCCLMRSVTNDKLGFIRTDIPPPLQYPVKKSGFEFSSALVSMFYGDGLWARFKASMKLAAIAIKGK